MPRQLTTSALQSLNLRSKRTQNSVRCLNSSITPTEFGVYGWILENGPNGDFNASTQEELKRDRTAVYNFIQSTYRPMRDENVLQVGSVIVQSVNDESSNPSDWEIVIQLEVVDPNSKEGIALNHARKMRKQSIAETKRRKAELESMNSSEVTTRELTEEEEEEMFAS